MLASYAIYFSCHESVNVKQLHSRFCEFGICVYMFAVVNDLAFHAELDKLLEDAPSPFVMQHAAKISSIRKRVAALNLLLRSVQRRIDNIDRILSTGIQSGISFGNFYIYVPANHLFTYIIHLIFVTYVPFKI